jgi:pimeloyl-ACP methyl ester carboxylesterase
MEYLCVSSLTSVSRSDFTHITTKHPQTATMSAQTVPTQDVAVKGTKIAYRRFGQPSSIPLLYLNHFCGTMDISDPLLANSIAASRELILFNSAGCGHSEGTIQSTLQEAGSAAADFLSAIGVSKADLLGFSMGGMTAQYIAIEHPNAVNKLILSDTQSSYTEGMAFADPAIVPLAARPDPTEEIMTKLIFYPSETSRALGHAWWQHIQERHVDGEERTTFVDEAGSQVMGAAITKFVNDPSVFEKLRQLDMPILVTNGKNDVMTPTPNSWLLQQNLRDVELHLFPDSGHGHLYQERRSRRRGLWNK